MAEVELSPGYLIFLASAFGAAQGGPSLPFLAAPSEFCGCAIRRLLFLWCPRLSIFLPLRASSSDVSLRPGDRSRRWRCGRVGVSLCVRFPTCFPGHLWCAPSLFVSLVRLVFPGFVSLSDQN